MYSIASKPGLRGCGHLVLNAIRPCNIITLLAIAVVCWIMIVMSGIRGSFFFFDAASHFFCSVIALALILTELSLLKSYFRANWPLFSHEHGLTWLGTAMVVMGCQVLGNLNEKAIQPKEIGRSIHSLVLATGILALTFGVVNIATSIVFSDRKAGINARMIRSDGNLASPKNAEDDSTRSGSVLGEEKETKTNRWTRRLTFANGRRLKISRPILQDPQDVESQFQSDSWRDSRSSPIIPEVRRPDTAMHPMNTGVSRYSEVSHLPRF
ncbi:hypothetical protein VUR80DRAFT_7020 [Thermomyces stellatus]